MTFRCSRAVLSGALVLALTVPALALGGDEKAYSSDKKEMKEGAGGMMPMPKPGPEHAMLQHMVGKWKSVTTASRDPNMPKMSWEGTVEAHSICNGLWFESIHRSTDPKMPFEGHDIQGYNPDSKKFVGTWVDSWTTSMTPYEGTWDPDAKKMSYHMTVMDPTGKEAKMLMVIEMQDDDHHTMKMWMTPEESGEPMMTITYTRMADKSITPVRKRS
jgi:hypothetical protein